MRVVAGIVDPGRRSQRLRLQFTNRFADIVHCDVGRDSRRTNVRRDNKSNFSGFEFLVELQRVDDFLARNASRQLRW